MADLVKDRPVWGSVQHDLDEMAASVRVPGQDLDHIVAEICPEEEGSRRGTFEDDRGTHQNPAVRWREARRNHWDHCT